MTAPGARRTGPDADAIAGPTESTGFEPAAGVERLLVLYARSGPFVSAYLRHAADGGDDAERFGAMRMDLEAIGATPEALDAAEARFSLPVFDEVAGRAVIAASDGTAVADAAPEGPDEDFVVVESLPYGAPLLEWDQWRVPHLVLSATVHGHDLVAFVPGQVPALRPCGTTAAAAAAEATAEAAEAGIDLVIVAGQPEVAEELSAALRAARPGSFDLRQLDPDEIDTPDHLAAAVVRSVSDHVARATVHSLERFRTARTAGSAAEGSDDTLDALAHGRGELLLVHDDPADRRRAAFGPDAVQLGPLGTDGLPFEGRLVDVAIRSALLQGMAVRIVPTTTDNGPRDNVGVAW